VAGSVRQVAPNSVLKKAKKFTLFSPFAQGNQKEGRLYIRFDENAGVLVSKEACEPKGTDFRPIPRELREKAVGKFEDGVKKILSLARSNIIHRCTDNTDSTDLNNEEL